MTSGPTTKTQPLSSVAADWLSSRSLVKGRTRESDESNWRNYVRPRFGNWPVASITGAEVSARVGGLVARGLAPSTATRALATLRSILAFAVADGRVQHNAAARCVSRTGKRSIGWVAAKAAGWACPQRQLSSVSQSALTPV